MFGVVFGVPSRGRVVDIACDRRLTALLSAVRVETPMVWTATSRAVLLVALAGSVTILARPSVAQAPRVLTGKVVDSNGQVVPGVLLSVQSFNKYLVTAGEAGRFRLELTDDDTITVSFLMIGYQRQTYRLDSLEALLRRHEDVVLTAITPRFIDSFPPSRPLNILDDTIPDLVHGAMARAAGLKPLYEHGARSPREIRLTTNWGLGAPDVMIVLRKRGNRVDGYLFHAYGRVLGQGDRVDTTALANAMRQSRCKEPRLMDESAIRIERNYQHVTIVCRPQIRKTPNWRKLWRTLQSVDVWTLPDDDELTRSGIIPTHGACVAIETFNGKYRHVDHCEGSLVASPESARAERLLKLVTGVAMQIR